MMKHYNQLLRTSLLGAFILVALIGFSQNTQIVADEFQLDDVYTMPGAASASSSISCTITNLQGAIGSGTLGIFAISGQGVSTLINPEGTGAPADPGCFLDEVYPFTITNVQLNPFSAGAFGIPAAEGVGTMVYKVSILEAVDNAGCTEIGASLFTSPDQTFEVTTAANQYPATIPVGIDVDGAFFVFVESVSWSGAVNRAPSMVLWNNGVTGTPVPACRQYVTSFNAESELVVTDFPAFFATAPGWTNVVVNGEAPDIVGDIDVSVSNVAGPAEYTQGIAATITADVSNIGDATLPAVSVTLTANGTEVGTQSVAVAAGATENISFSYTPAAPGDVTLTVTASQDGDIDESNNSASIEITVNAPADPCIFSDDIESYAEGAVSPQDAQWALWTPGAPASDGFVSTEQALSGTQSVRTDGATDILYLLGNQATGMWRVSMNLYIPEGNGGYFNIQKTQVAGAEFAVEVILENTGVASVNAGTLGAATFDFAQGQWNEFALDIDIEADVANLLLNGTLVHQWPYSWEANSTTPSLSSIGAINFYPAGADAPLMYIDDVAICITDNESPCTAFGLVEGVAVVGDNTGATPFDPDLEADATGCWSDGPTIDGDVWYSFDVPADGDYLVTTNLEVLSNDDTQLLVYTSSDNTCEGVLTAVGCGDDVDGSNFLSEVLLEGLTAGTRIFILVDGWDGTEGQFQIAVLATTAPEPPANNLCPDAIDVSALTVGSPGDTNTSDTFTNLNATPGDGVLPTCFEDGSDGTGEIDNTVWFTFTGTGDTFYIFTNDCNGTAADYIDFGDTQMAIFTGACGSLNEVACNEDIDLAGGNYAAGLELATDDGVEYTIMIDGYGAADGEFCISFENMGNPDGLAEAAQYGVTMFPNPTTDFVRIHADANMTNVIVLNSVGQLVGQLDNVAGTDLLIDVASYAKGLYFVQMTIDGTVITQKLNVQ